MQAGDESSAGSYSSQITFRADERNVSLYSGERALCGDVVREDLGLEELDADITATALENTSLFQISVASDDPDLSYQVLQSVIDNYPQVAKYIVGNTTLTLLDTTGVPSALQQCCGKEDAADLGRGRRRSAGVSGRLLIIFSYLRRTVMSGETLKRYTNVQCIGSIPRNYMKRRSNKSSQLMLIDRRTATPSLYRSGQYAVHPFFQTAEKGRAENPGDHQRGGGERENPPFRPISP